jgi:hypothetical protein
MKFNSQRIPHFSKTGGPIAFDSWFFKYVSGEITGILTITGRRRHLSRNSLTEIQVERSVNRLFLIEELRGHFKT